MVEMQKVDVLVVGAGPVGLFTALLLTEGGARVQIIDEQWTSATRSYALALHPRTLALFNELGFAKTLVQQANCVDRLGFYDRQQKKLEVRFDQVSSDFPFVAVLPQQLLEEVLTAQLKNRGVKVLWNHRLSDLKAGESEVEVEIERLAKESTGYSVSRMEWVVDKTFKGRVGCVVGADGYRSLVRRKLGIEFEEVGGSSVFEVFEFMTDSQSGSELQVVLEKETTNVLWPMSGGRFRWSFESTDAATDPRAKSRLLVQFRDDAYPHVSEEKLANLIAERAPWFEANPTEVLWSAAIRFERRLAGAFSRGRVMLIGDAAHVALPIGIQSMNVGFREAKSLSSKVLSVLNGEHPAGYLDSYDKEWKAEWSEMIATTEGPTVSPNADPWIRERAGRIPACIPASGDDLKQLLSGIL